MVQEKAVLLHKFGQLSQNRQFNQKKKYAEVQASPLSFGRRNSF